MDVITFLVEFNRNGGSTIFTGITLFKHKGKTCEIKTLFSLRVLRALGGEAFSR